MSLTVNTNVASLNAQRNMMANQSGLQTAMTRLSSGLRINSAKDDAAGLQIANRLEKQFRGLGVAMRNANDGISLAQTAEGALQEVTNILQRVRELSIQAGNGINSAEDITAIQSEVDALGAEITRISSTTKFGSQTLLDAANTFTFQVGANDSETVDVATVDVAAIGTAVTGIDLATDYNTGITVSDTQIAAVDTARSDIGAVMNRLSYTISNLANVQENVAASKSRIMDADFAAETANMTKFQILQQAGTAMLAQANTSPQIALSLLQ